MQKNLKMPQPKAAWVRPTLVQKSLDETRGGLGAIHDALTDRS